MENILSVGDQNFLENIYKNFGVMNIVYDDSGVKFSNDFPSGSLDFNESNFNYLNEIFKKLKYRINSNFRMEFSATGFDINVIRN